VNLIAFIKELRRREVFRTAGMYVGVSWILFEVASLVLPVFDAPDWLLRTIIIIAFAGFPVTLALAWIYDVTERGIVIQPDASDTVILPIGKHRSDYVVMAVLVLALVLSLGLNAFRDDAAGESTADAGISLIISKFENRSGDSIFDNALPYALRSNFENARLVFACIDLPSVPCSAELRVSGSIARDTDNYELTLVAARESDGTEFATVHGSTSRREGVYEALGQLSGKLLASLGADSYNGMAPVYFVPSSVDAADRYARAEMLRLDGQNESAQLLFEKALQVDPGLVHARIGLDRCEQQRIRLERTRATPLARPVPVSCTAKSARREQNTSGVIDRFSRGQRRPTSARRNLLSKPGVFLRTSGSACVR